MIGTVDNEKQIMNIEIFWKMSYMLYSLALGKVMLCISCSAIDSKCRVFPNTCPCFIPINISATLVSAAGSASCTRPAQASFKLLQHFTASSDFHTDIWTRLQAQVWPTNCDIAWQLLCTISGCRKILEIIMVYNWHNLQNILKAKHFCKLGSFVNTRIGS